MSANEGAVMGRVVVKAKVENIQDVYNAVTGQLVADQIRWAEVEDALIDTGATNLLLPGKMIRQLGLLPVRNRQARTVGGVVTLAIYSAVRLTVQGRDCVTDVGEVPDDYPIIIGQVPLELMDWVVDPRGQKLIGNPDHGGEHMLDAL